MKRRHYSDRPDQSFFAIEDRGEAEVLRIHSREELPGSHEQIVSQLLTFLDGMRKRRKKVLAIIVPPGLLNPSNMSLFWERVERLSPGWGFTPDSGSEVELIKSENAFFRFISIVRGADTFVVCSLQGEIVFPFLGLALACDYRIVSDDTVFVNQCWKLGIPPCGALPWFFARHVGKGKTVQILFERESLPAAEALELGLVDRVVSGELMDREVADVVDSFASKPTGGLVSAKRMLNAAHLDLSGYLDRESKAFQWCLSEKRRSAVRRET